MTDSMDMITRQQAEQVAQLATIVRQFSTMMAAMDQRMARIEKLLDRKVTIEAKQYKALLKAIKERARALCDKHHLDQKDAGRAIRKAITADILARYGVSDLHDLQDSYFDIAMAEINAFTSYALICKLRGK